MGGTSMKAMKDTSVDNENSNDAEVTSAEVDSAESILSHQNGSPRENQYGGLGVTEPDPKNLLEENASLDNFNDGPDNRWEFFPDIIRNKLISEFSSTIFHSNLDNEINKMDPVQINTERLSVIQEILIQIYLLSDREKFLLYLKLPNSRNSTADLLTLPLNPLGNRLEIQQAIVWIKTHLEENEEKSVLKKDVYDQYVRYCRNGSMKPLSASDFGKVIKQVYPEIRPQRLGSRANSRYCYSGMGNIVRLPTPHLPKSVRESNVAKSSTKNSCGSMLTEIKEGETEYHEEKFEKPSKSSKIASATVVKNSVPNNSKLSHTENLSMENKVTTDSAIEKNFTIDLNASSENQNNSNQPLLPLPTKKVDDINCTLGKDLNVSSDNFADVMKNDYTNDKINLDFLDKDELNNEELYLTGADETDKSNEVNSTQDTESTETQSSKFPLKLPLWIFKRIIQVEAFDGLYNQRTQRFQGRRRSQRLRARRPRPQSRRCRRIRCLPSRYKPLNNGTCRLNIQSDLEDKKSEVSEFDREKVKYFGHLENSELLGVVGETIVEKLLRLEKIAGNIFSGMTNIQGEGSQSYLENISGTHMPVGTSVQEGLPRRSQSSAEYSAEPTVTFQKQGNTEYVSNHNLLISNRKNIVNINMVQVNPQNNDVTDSSCENSSMSESVSESVSEPVSPHPNDYHFSHISPDPRTPLLTPEARPFSSHQNAQTMLHNNFLPTNNYLPPDSHFLPLNYEFPPPDNVLPATHDFLSPNNNFLPSNNNNFLPPNYNPVSSDSTFPPENNPDLNGFDNINTGTLNTGFNVQNNIILEGNFQEPVSDITPGNPYANFYHPSAPENSHEISTFYQFLPNEMNFNQTSIETDSAFPNLSEQIDQLLMNQPNFDYPGASTTMSESAPANSMTGGEYWFPNNNTYNDTNNIFYEYSEEHPNGLGFNQYNFEPISDCQNMEPVIEDEPFPELSLDDLVMDGDDITDEIFSHNFACDFDSIISDNKSLDAFPSKIDESNVFESSFCTENINSYLEASEGPVNQTDPLLELEAGDLDLLDNLFDDIIDNSNDSGSEGTRTVGMNECPNDHDPSASDIFSYGDDINDQLKELFDLN